MLMKKSAEEHWVCNLTSAQNAFMINEINVNMGEHPCNSLQPFLILWMIILGSSVQGFVSKQSTADSEACSVQN